MNVERHARVVSNPRLINLFKVGVRRKAFNIIHQPHDNPPNAESQKFLDWSKRVLEYKDDKSAYYASLILEALLEEDAEFRGLVEQQLNTDELLSNGMLDVQDEQLISLVEPWVALFIAYGY